MTIEATAEPTSAADTGVIATQTEQAESAPLSLKEHATLYSEKADTLPEDKKAKLEEKAAHHAESQKREKDGKFTEGKTRHRAASQQARAEDVPRIKELTARARSAEDRLAAAEAEVHRLKTQHAPAAQVAQAERKVEQAESRVPDASDPEPNEDDAKYGGDYAKYLRDVTRWETRQAIKADRAESEQRAEKAQREEAKTATIKTFAERLTTAGTTYGDDFQETLRWDAPWLAPSGEAHKGYEAIHDFIMDDDAGPDVLHYLRTHQEDVDALLEMKPLHQVKRLTLLAQRFASSTSTAADTTGAAPRQATVIKLPPRPPTPVRTEASSQGHKPPSTDGSLSVLGHAKAFTYRK